MTRIALDEFVKTLDPDMPTIGMFAPSLHLETVDTVYDSAATVLWRADIVMTHLESRLGDPDVVVGRMHFVMVRIGVGGLAQALRDREQYHHLRTDRFAPLFDDYRIGPELAQQFSDCVEVVLLPLWLDVDPALQGHRLGAWALCQCIDTMIPTTNGLILMHPHWDAEADLAPSVEQLESVERLNKYWLTTGLVPLTAGPQFLGQHANRQALETALHDYRQRFFGDDDYVIDVPLDPLRQRIRDGGDFL
ncbi:MAG: hypothetical protein CK429_32660 [Mycobacterium sp.]|nr:MAG: hypothetical protein CK429_32660 [Mycobacterium sp.]